MMTYDDMYKLLKWLERKHLLAGSLTADLIMPLLTREDEQKDIFDGLNKA